MEFLQLSARAAAAVSWNVCLAPIAAWHFAFEAWQVPMRAGADTRRRGRFFLLILLYGPPYKAACIIM